MSIQFDGKLYPIKWNNKAQIKNQRTKGKLTCPNRTDKRKVSGKDN